MAKTEEENAQATLQFHSGFGHLGYRAMRHDGFARRSQVTGNWGYVDLECLP